MPNPTDPISESAKATQEVAKVTGQGIDLARAFGGFLNRVFGRAIEDTVGLYWTDRVTAKRIEASIYDVGQLALLLEKTQQRLHEKGVLNNRAVPPKVALPLLEYATIEHEDDLHTLWANLLATGMDSDAEQIHRKYVTTLGEMTTDDAGVLRAMFRDAENDISKKETRVSSLTYGPGVDGTHAHGEIAVITLNRLGLIEPAYIMFKNFEPGGHDERYGDYSSSQEEVSFPGDLSSVRITEFGYAFGRAIGLTS